MVSVLPIRALPSMRSSLRARFLARALPHSRSLLHTLFLARVPSRPRSSSPAFFLARALPRPRSSSPALFLARALPRPRSSSPALFLARAFSSRGLLILKRPTNILGQEIGIVADFFPVEPSVYALDVSHLHKLDFRVVEKLSDEVLGCNSQINEVDFYRCAKSTISKQIGANSGPDSCKVPMFEEFYTSQ